MKYKVKSKRDAIYERDCVLKHLYILEDLMSYRKNKITEMIDFLQKIDFEVE